MGSKAYDIGRTFEHRVQRYFQEQGWFCMLSAGSHSMADLMAATKDKPTVIIQCRRSAVPYFGGGKLSKIEFAELVEAHDKYGVVPLLAAYVKGGSIILTNLITQQSSEVRPKPVPRKKKNGIEEEYNESEL